MCRVLNSLGYTIVMHGELRRLRISSELAPSPIWMICFGMRKR